MSPWHYIDNTTHKDTWSSRLILTRCKPSTPPSGPCLACDGPWSRLWSNSSAPCRVQIYALSILSTIIIFSTSHTLITGTITTSNWQQHSTCSMLLSSMSSTTITGAQGALGGLGRQEGERVLDGSCTGGGSEVLGVGAGPSIPDTVVCT